jgi:ABC-type amino acid transport substrate-binding protein
VPKPPNKQPSKWRARVKLWSPIVVILALLAAVNFLPPDTSLDEVRRTGALRVCVPTEYPPLVIANAERPGLEVEMVRDLARRMDLRLSLNTNSTMGRDLNPRNWRLTRAQCQIIAGGVLGSDATRSYLETTSPHLEAGWSVILPKAVDGLEGREVGFFAGFSGFDRISLSRFLREAGARVKVVNSRAELENGLRDGTFDLGITESLGGRQIAADNGWSIQWLSPDLGNIPVAFGLWKGDLTLQRAIEAGLADMRRDGTLNALLAKYELDRDIDAFFTQASAEPEVEQQ